MTRTEEDEEEEEEEREEEDHPDYGKPIADTTSGLKVRVNYFVTQ